MDKILLDTTYFLPLFGIKIKLKDFENVFPKILSNYKAMYNPISFIEAKWIILKLLKEKHEIKDQLLESYKIGLKAILTDNRFLQTVITNSEIENIADKLLLKAGIKDYFDRIIYATSAIYNAILLTEDEELTTINLEDIEKPEKIISWNIIINL
jgi:PIN domain nuclease of toxin-antitoxin system